jgi:putative membrane protein
MLLVAFVSPLCALTSGLFAARSAHHLLLVAVAGPLIGYALRVGRHGSLASLAIFHIMVFWLWHVPTAYGWAMSNDVVYWTVQLSLLGSAVWFWGAIFRGDNIAGEVGALIAVIGQMGLLGAILTFAPEALYAPHFLTTSLYGLSPLEDQQAAGLIMWVASLPLYLAAAVPVFARRGAEFRQAAA